MDSKYDPIRGLQIKHGFHKSVLKGEDAWLQKPDTQPLDKKNGCCMDIFGIFDGHGGKQAAVFSSKHTLEHLKTAISSCIEKVEAPETVVPEELQACTEINKATWAYWKAQEELAASLPEAYVSSFKSLQAAIFEHIQESGTTGTVLSVVGWEVVVANVGDSCAYLDTGSEVVQISGNHRLDDNKKEQERIRGQGFEVSSSKIEGRKTGPLRVWPGGLAMGRTLGDFGAGDIVTCEPEVRQVTLPEQGGRIVIASDGLWDNVNYKTALHHIRGTPASKAARELVQLSVKDPTLKDDVTVLVIDAIPDSEHKLPPLLSKDGAGNLHSDYMHVDSVNVYHPLEDGAVGRAALQKLSWARRLAAVKSAYPETFRNAADMEDLISVSLTETHIDSGDEVLKALPSRQSDIVGSFVSHDMDYSAEASHDENLEDDAGWETVPEKVKLVPVSKRKHALPRTDGSPQEIFQAPKVLKEAPPSPAPASMQTSEMGSTKGSFYGRYRGRGRGRSHGRGHAGRRAVHPAQQQVEGFQAPHQDYQAENGCISQQPQYNQHNVHVECSAPDNFSFLAGGGFQIQQDAVQGFADHSVPPGFEHVMDQSQGQRSEDHLLAGKQRRPSRRRYWQGRRDSRGRGQPERIGDQPAAV